VTTSISLEFTAWGPDLLAIARQLIALPAFGRAPDELQIAGRKVQPAKHWPVALDATTSGQASWGDLSESYFSFRPPYITSVRLPDFPADPAAAIRLIEPLPFELITFGVLHESWLKSYTPPGFSNMQALLGWACAFRGAGHDNLVSRRWLDYGPWRLIRSAGDLSFVQFHDLAADGDTALAQAKPGHERMGISETGGYLQSDYVYRSEVRGLYLANERKLVISAAGPVSQVEMRDACAARRDRRNDPKEPIERIAYMFITEDLARDHLHELWLRDLECWTLVLGKKVRLDENYAPPIVKPDWVTRLSA
jgi:hypothetical protein